MQVIQSQLLGVLPQHSPTSVIPSQHGKDPVGTHWAGFAMKKNEKRLVSRKEGGRKEKRKEGRERAKEGKRKNGRKD